MILVVLVDALGDEKFAEKLDAVKYSSTLIVLSPHALIRDLISLTTIPTSAGPIACGPRHLTVHSPAHRVFSHFCCE